MTPLYSLYRKGYEMSLEDAYWDVLEQGEYVNELKIVYDAKYKNFCILLHHFDSGVLTYTLMLHEPSVHGLLARIEEISLRVDMDFTTGWMHLPHMGDYQIEYHKPE